MTTSVIRFEVLLPYVDNNSDITSWNAIQKFITDISTLLVDAKNRSAYIYQTYPTQGQPSPQTLYGYILSTQTTQALALLATLNAALPPLLSPVICATWNATLEP